jgi:hypothetical protein
MRADMLTKPLPRKTFERHRNAIQGWWLNTTESLILFSGVSLIPSSGS